MASASGESLEKLEDMIVRAAESTAVHVRAAKAAIGAVIFGQDIVVRETRTDDVDDVRFGLPVHVRDKVGDAFFRPLLGRDGAEVFLMHGGGSAGRIESGANGLRRFCQNTSRHVAGQGNHGVT